MLKDKKSQSEMIAYVLLIVIAIAMSIIVYKYMKSYVPSESDVCPDDANLIIRDYSCDNRSHIIYLDLENKGLFSVDGFKIRGSKDPNKETATTLLGKGPGGNGYYTFSKRIEPGEKETKIVNYQSEYLTGKLDDLAFIEILPSIFDVENEKSTLCSNAKVKQKVTCDYDDSLIMHLKFDGTTYDATRKLNHGSCNLTASTCPTLVSGASGISRAYYFNGSQYIVVKDNQDNPSFKTGTGSFTLSLWVKGITPVGERYLIDKLKRDSTSEIKLTTSNFVLRDSSTGYSSSLDFLPTISPWNDNWHHMAFVFDKEIGQINGYFDSANFVNSNNAPTTNIMANNGNLTIGTTVDPITNMPFVNKGFNGTIDDVRIYTRALSADEIRKIYQNGA